MPRLTALDYLHQRAALREEWTLRDGYAFALVSTSDQFYLHDFFEPAKKLSPLEATAHRQDVTARRRSLPQQAGRAFAHIRPFLDLPPPECHPRTESRTGGAKPKAGARRVHAFSQVNPELDPKAFAKIIIELAKTGPPPGMDKG